MLRKYDENDLMAKLFLLFNALLHGVTGGYLLVNSGVEYQSDTYYAMSRFMSLDAWGFVFLGAAALFIAAAFHEGHFRLWLSVFAGTIGAAIFGLYAMAAAELAVNFLVPARYAITASFNAIIAVIGGHELWKRRN